MKAANDDGLPIECGACERVGEIAVIDGALVASAGFDLVDGSPVCACGELAGMRIAALR